LSGINRFIFTGDFTLNLNTSKMAYDPQLANRVREAFMQQKNIEEKKMFGGLAFLVNGKMCVNVTSRGLMCRFDPALQERISEKTGFLPMIMRGRQLDGYCYVSPEGFKRKKDFEWWIDLCLQFNKTLR